MDAATVARDRTVPDWCGACPALAPATRATYQEAAKAASRLSREFHRFLNERDRSDQAAALGATWELARELFQPWAMEILFLTGLAGRSRFSALERELGISSRVLSNKLKRLTAAGFLERMVHDEVPVRIEYALTRHGRAAAALATPLFVYLCVDAVDDNG